MKKETINASTCEYVAPSVKNVELELENPVLDGSGGTTNEDQTPTDPNW